MKAHTCYLRSYALDSRLGKEPAALIRTLSPETYEAFCEETFKTKPYYALQTAFSSEEEKFYTTLSHVIAQSLERSGLTAEEQRETALFIGSTSMGISLHEETHQRFCDDGTHKEFNHLGYGFIGSHIESLLNTRHKALIFSTACTSSSNAFAYAAKQIQEGRIKHALVVGIELFNQTTYKGFSSLMLLSQAMRYRPFDANSDGIILGEGLSAILLSNTPSSQDNFYVVSAYNQCDIYSETTSNPTGEPIFATMHEALKEGNITLDDIDCIKAHATGSENNNTSEANALSLLFDHYQTTKPVTALKPYIGHTLGASGTNEMALLLACINEGFIPQALGFHTPSSTLHPLKAPLSCSKATLMLNSIAFGGNNTTLIISNK